MNQNECATEEVLNSNCKFDTCQPIDTISFGEDTELDCLNGLDDIQEDNGPFKPYRNKIRELKEELGKLKEKYKKLDEECKYQTKKADRLYAEVYWGGK